MEYISIDKGHMAEIAGANNFSVNGIERVARLYNLLNAFSGIPVIRDHVALKGGTSLNLFILDNLPRISEDLDFDLYGDEVIDKDIMQTMMERHILPAIVGVAKDQGYDITRPDRRRWGLSQFVLRYKTVTGSLDGIKLDLNYLSRVHVKPTVFCMKQSTIFGHEIKAVLLNPLETIAEKMVATMERTKPRDIFDMDNLSRHQFESRDDYQEIRKLAVFHAALHGLSSNDIDGIIDRITSVPFQAFKQDVLSTVRRNQGFFDAETIKRNTSLFMSSILLSMTQDESDYLASYTKGTFKPELLFPDLKETLLRHPKYLADKASREAKKEVVKKQAKTVTSTAPKIRR